MAWHLIEISDALSSDTGFGDSIYSSNTSLMKNLGWSTRIQWQYKREIDALIVSHSGIFNKMTQNDTKAKCDITRCDVARCDVTRLM